MKKHPYVIGDFVWTLQDHLGECNCCELHYGETEVKKEYPWVSNWCGKLDLIGDENITAHRYRMVWGMETGIVVAAQPPVHDGAEAQFNNDRETDAVMSWTFEGCEGNKTYLDVVTNAPRAEVLINGKSLGIKEVSDFHARFFAAYEPGEVLARGLDEAEKVLFETCLKTAGKETRLRLTPDTTVLRADGQDVAFVGITVTDEEGNVKSMPEYLLRAHVCGVGTLAGFGSAAYQSEHGFCEGVYRTYNGRALAVIRAGVVPGKITLTVQGEHLPEQEITFEVVV